MHRRRTRQLELSLGAQTVSWLSKDKEREVVEALTELLLAAVQERNGDDEGDEDEHQDHR